ncbi:phosphatase PAP2 family protein [Sellimonas caecigallum]|uniref:Phosphatase PAP2 family protein n=1 Tax=Sellimonas caecigallum TaxID=2592333 RepID=A0ABS7L5T3_9FIRM|nr:phosphatase PAP2 family protein [Sellimonas caecigallum]MBY0758398.1 phosphatase PAP2 family protein [Sellimonas caecigallum]
MEFLYFLEGIRTPIGNEFFQFVTYFGQEMLLVAVICIFYWCLDKSFAYQLALTYFSAGLCVQALKITFRIPRPWILDPEFAPVKSAVPAATGYSFPSGHTQGGTCLFAPLALRAKKTVLKLLFTAAFLLIGFSRMYLGVHTPKDVLVSMGVSLFFSVLIWKYKDQILEHPRKVRTLSLILGVISILVILYTIIQLFVFSLPEKYASDCLKAGGAGLGFAVGFFLEKTYIRFSPETPRWTFQIPKLLLGLFSALLLKNGLSLLAGLGMIFKSAEYFLLVLWIIAGYPFLFQAFLKRKERR